MRYIFELSGEHPEIPFAELECIGTIISRDTQTAVVETEDPESGHRLAYTHFVMEWLGECRPEYARIKEMVQSCAITVTGTYAARVKKMQDTDIPDSQLDLEKLVGSCIQGKVSLQDPEDVYRLILTADRCYFGRVMYAIDRGSFGYRNPMRRAFFHPGVMMPILARGLVNLAQVKEGDLLFDPFCGTGGVLLEGEIVGADVLGSDMDLAMLGGCGENLPGAQLFQADATRLPLCDNTIDAVVTDLPYGQSVCIMAESMEHLYSRSLSEIRRILKPGGRAVVVTHVDIDDLAAENFSIIGSYRQRVHKSLTRRILVLS
jgi:tRNA (guanine10-N2)-dimethyltransferase